MYHTLQKFRLTGHKRQVWAPSNSSYIFVLTYFSDPTAAAAASGKAAKINIIGRRDEIKQFLTAGQSM